MELSTAKARIKKLTSLIDGIYELVESSTGNYAMTSPAQRAWRENWMNRAKAAITEQKEAGDADKRN